MYARQNAAEVTGDDEHETRSLVEAGGGDGDDGGSRIVGGEEVGGEDNVR